MTSIVRITSGSYRNETIKGEVFTLVKGYQLGSKGGFVTVKNEGQFPGRPAQVRVNVDSQSMIEFVSGRDAVKVETPKETDEEAMDRIATRFSVLDEMSKACISGDIRAMIVTGPAGIGKSHGVNLQMEKASMFDQLAGKKIRFEVVKGAMSGIGLFAKLYKFSDAKNVLVFDDCDIWEDQDAINVLKGALDSGKTRRSGHPNRAVDPSVGTQEISVGVRNHRLGPNASHARRGVDHGSRRHRYAQHPAQVPE